MVLHNISHLCEKKGLNFAEVERLAGLKPRTIYSWDHVMPAADKLKKVADALGTTVEELLNDESEVREESV